MDLFNDGFFLSKEWLVKIDAHSSTPYLIKFHSSPVDLTCSIMVTDTKQTWAEMLSSNQFARRWRECNRQIDSPPLDDDEEGVWRTRSLDLLSSAHTLGGMPQLSFEVINSKYGDFAFQLECDAFKWRWETIFVGYKISAEVLSKHLIIPLISMNHLAFSSTDVVGDLSPADLEKTVDKVARTARRTLDTHIKNALSKPRMATTMRRITAVFNFNSYPPITSTETDSPIHMPPEPTPKLILIPKRHETTRGFNPEADDRHHTSVTSERERAAHSQPSTQISNAADSGSATEPEDDSQPPRPGSGPGADQPPDIRMRSPTPSREARGIRARDVTKPPSDTDSSPIRPIKKSKPRSVSSDEDSEEQEKRASQIRNGIASGPGLRQPIKRRGRRF